MDTKTKKEKNHFWSKWILFNALGLFIGYAISMFISVLMDFNDHVEYEWSSPIYQTTKFIIVGTFIGLCVGFTQWLLLRKRFKVSLFWVFSVALGFIIAELIIGFALWKQDINRDTLTFIESGKPAAYVLIKFFTGLIIGLIQLPMLREYFSKVYYWIFASSLAWGISALIPAIMPRSNYAFVITFILGFLLYGSITGAVLTWLQPSKEIKQ